MTKEQLVIILQKLLKNDTDLSFLLQLEKTDLEKLIACIRERVDGFN